MRVLDKKDSEVYCDVDTYEWNMHMENKTSVMCCAKPDRTAIYVKMKV